jgi:hypothetical protein
MERSAGFHQFMRNLLQPKPLDDRKEALRLRLRANIATMFADVDDAEPEARSFEAADRIMRREALIDGLSGCMAEASMGTHFKKRLEPDCVATLLAKGFLLYRRDGKTKTRVYLPGHTEAQCCRNFRPKPYVLVTATPPADL